MAYTAAVVGTQTTVNQLAANQMPDVDKMLYLLKPYQTPLFQKYFFDSKGSAKVINENGKFSWFEDEYYPHSTTITNITGGAASEDNITLGSGAWINEGDILLIEDTLQLVYVDSTASSQIDITTLDGTTNITACATGHITKVGSRNAEFATARTATFTKEIEKYNYCTIFSETVTTSGRYQAGEKYTNGKSHADKVKKLTIEMKYQFERNFWFSTEQYTGTINTDYRFTFGQGAIGRITTNKVQYSGALSEPALDDFLMSIFQKGSNVKDIYMGSQALNDINKFVKAKYELAGMTKEYGVDVSSYITPFGKVNLIWNPVFTNRFSTWAIALDPEGVKMRYMDSDDKGSRKFRVEEGVETPGTDGKSTKILADLGIQIANEELHGILYQ